MNHRSLGFRLVAWYAGLLSAIFVCVAIAMYLGLQQYLQLTLRDTLSRRSKQITQIVSSFQGHASDAAMADEINTRLAPELTNRFVRITRNGAVVYESGTPSDNSFDPHEVGAAIAKSNAEFVRRVTMSSGHDILILATPLRGGSDSYLIEVGASLDPIVTTQDHLLLMLIVMLPVLAGVAISGGFILVKRALKPVEEISQTAAQITLHNLSERLPIQRTGDELERLSVSLNHMIARLDESFQSSRRFLADASHELRTPLTIIKGELEELVRTGLLADNVRDRIGSVLEEVQRITHIVEGLFALSRLDVGEAQREWVKFDLAELVASTADQMSLLAEDKKLTVVCDSSSKVVIEGDRARLKQVIVNLLDNAIKYTPTGGAVQLKVSRADRYAILDVVDNGIGIPSDALPHVFERFYRVDESRSRDAGGAGLGLSIVKAICAAHGAQVEVTSVPGKGSRFRILQPLASDSASHA